jgi:hypothetical protein
MYYVQTMPNKMFCVFHCPLSDWKINLIKGCADTTKKSGLMFFFLHKVLDMNPGLRPSISSHSNISKEKLGKNCLASHCNKNHKTLPQNLSTHRKPLDQNDKTAEHD